LVNFHATNMPHDQHTFVSKRTSQYQRIFENEIESANSFRIRRLCTTVTQEVASSSLVNPAPFSRKTFRIAGFFVSGLLSFTLERILFHEYGTCTPRPTAFPHTRSTHRSPAKIPPCGTNSGTLLVKTGVHSNRDPLGKLACDTVQSS